MKNIQKALAVVGLIALITFALSQNEGFAQVACDNRLPFCFAGNSPAQADQVNQNFNAVLSTLDSALSARVPVGTIVLWSGATNAVPAGWSLCDGNNGTPDLRNRFVVGAGSTYVPGDTGGLTSVTLTAAQMPSHTHSASTTSTGAHYHTIKVDTGGGGSCGGQSGGMLHNADTITGAICNEQARTVTEGGHSHSISVTASGSGGSHENRPPYYGLAYIMRTGS